MVASGSNGTTAQQSRRATIPAVRRDAAGGGSGGPSPGMNTGTLLLLAQKTWQGYSRDNCSQMAAGIAYHILFAIVPLAMFVVSILALIAGSQDVQQRITDALSEEFELTTVDVSFELSSSGAARVEALYGAEAVSEVEAGLAALNEDEARDEERTAAANILRDGGPIVVAGYPLFDDDIDTHFDNILLETLHGVVSASRVVGVVSLLVLAYAASGLFGVVRRSLDFVWDTPRHLPMVTGKLLDVAMLFALVAMVVLMLLILAAVSLTSALLFRFLGELRGDDTLWIESVLWSFVWFILPPLFSFVLFLLLYRYGPHTHNSLRSVWPGALLAAVGFEVMKFGYSIYLTNFASFDVVYGALGGVLLFLLFVHLSAQVFLIGAELAAEYPRVMRGDYPLHQVPAERTTLRQKVESALRSLFVDRTPP
jgi:YihY family inner membrane protein